MQAGNAVLVTVELKLEGESLRITAADACSLEKAASEAASGLRVWLDRTEAVPTIRTILAREAKGQGQGRGRVTLVPRLDEAQSVEITLPGGFHVTPRLAQALKAVQGVRRVEEG